MKRLRWILAVLALPPAAFILFLLGGSLIERGTTICMICADEREETRFCGLLVDTDPAAQSAGSALGRYNRWFEDDQGASHSHSRRRIGCWSVGHSRIECSIFWGEPFYGVVPDLPDQEMAREFAERMLHAPRRGKLRILQYCERVRCGTLEESMVVDMPPEVVERLEGCGFP